MLAAEVSLDQVRRHRWLRLETQSQERQLRHTFQRGRVLHRVERVPAPGERPVVRHQHCGDLGRFRAAKPLDDERKRFFAAITSPSHPSPLSWLKTVPTGGHRPHGTP
jgi:hypothetical protein